jgi:hypothetical protein
MKTRTTSSMLIALLAALLTLGASNAQAITINGVPVGIAIGQTARVSALNFGDEYIETSVKFLNEDSDLLAEFRGTIEPGRTQSFDLNRDTLIREGNRIEIHAVIEIQQRHRREVAISLEVFNNDDGKTLAVLTILNDFRDNITANASPPARLKDNPDHIASRGP